MVYLSDEKLKEIHRAGGVKILNVKQPVKNSVEEKPAAENPQAKSLQSISDSLRNMMPAAAQIKLDEQKIKLLFSISETLNAIKALQETSDNSPPAPAEKEHKKKKWMFQINRDANGRLESIDAIPEEGD